MQYFDELQCSLFFVLLTLSHFLQFAHGAVPLSDFFPFGTGSEEHQLRRGDDTSSGRLSIQIKFPFFDELYDSLWINLNGAISFSNEIRRFTPICAPATRQYQSIAPYWADIDISRSGNIHYHQSTKPEELAKAQREIANAFPNLANVIRPKWLLAVTWNNVTHYTDHGGRWGKRNTFQAIITTDGRHSFAIFYYNKLTWTTGDHMESGGSNGLGGIPAQAGFDYGDGKNRFMIPGSCTGDVLKIAERSNVDSPGKWVFRVDQANIESAGCSGVTDDKMLLLRVSPSFLFTVTQHPLELTGPCVDEKDLNMTTAFCQFHNSTGQIIDQREAVIVGNSSASLKFVCATPVFYEIGRLPIKLLIITNYTELTNNPSSLNQTLRSYKGYINVLRVQDSPNGTELKVEEVIEPTTNETKTLKFAWKPDNFPSTFKFVRIGILALMNAKWATTKAENNQLTTTTTTTTTVPEKYVQQQNEQKYIWVNFGTLLRKAVNNGTATIDASALVDQLSKRNPMDFANVRQMLYFVSKSCEKDDHDELGGDDCEAEHNGEKQPLLLDRYNANHHDTAGSRRRQKRWFPFLGFAARSLYAYAGRKAVAALSRRTLLHSATLLRSVISKGQSEAICRKWHSEDPGIDMSRLPACPPTSQLAEAEMDSGGVFEEEKAAKIVQIGLRFVFHRGSDWCIRSRHAEGYEGNRQQCCYQNGQLYLHPDRCGTADLSSTLKAHFVDDVIPWYHCCAGQQSSLCKLYMEKRPCDDGKEYKEKKSTKRAAVIGDPHMRTFDGLPYTFNGVGEFWLLYKRSAVNSNKTAIVPAGIQARFERSGSASVMTALALKQPHSSHVQIQYSKLRNVDVFIDGVPMDLENKETRKMSFSNVSVDVSTDRWTVNVLFPDTGMSFSIQTGSAFGLTAAIPDHLFEAETMFNGLFGVPDNDQSNDLLSRNGTLIPTDADLQQIHNEFGLSWHVAENESLFFYFDKNYNFYNNATTKFKPNFWFDPERASQKARGLCAGDLACLYDFENSEGKVEMANQTLNQFKAYNHTIAALKNPVPPMCQRITPFDNGHCFASSLFNGSVAECKCFEDYYLFYPADQRDGRENAPRNIQQQEWTLRCIASDDEIKSSHWINQDQPVNYSCVKLDDLLLPTNTQKPVEEPETQNLPLEFFGRWQLEHSENFNAYLDARFSPWSLDRLLMKKWMQNKLILAEPGSSDGSLFSWDLLYRNVRLNQFFICTGIHCGFTEKKIRFTYNSEEKTLYEEHRTAADNKFLWTYKYSVEKDGTVLVMNLQWGSVKAKLFYEKDNQ